MTTTKQLINRFTKFEFITGILCILLPFILMFTNGGTLKSVSAFAYSQIDFIYVWLLTMAGTLITVVGVRQNKPLIWVMGVLLLIVPLTPSEDYPTIHFVSAGLFFLGVVIDMIIDTQRLFKYRLFMVGAIVVSFAFHYFLNFISLFWAESIAIIIFGVNFLLDLIQEKKELVSGIRSEYKKDDKTIT